MLDHVHEVEDDWLPILLQVLSELKYVDSEGRFSVEAEGDGSDELTIRMNLKTGKIRLSPPLKVSGKVGRFRLNTTATEVIVQPQEGQLYVEIDNCPVDFVVKHVKKGEG